MNEINLHFSNFDFENHRARAVLDYQQIRTLYEGCSEAVKSILKQTFSEKGIKIATIEARAKAIDSFARKAATPNEEDQGSPKYVDPLTEITDLSGVRVITFFPNTIIEVEEVIKEQFEVIERINKTDILLKNERLGYQSVHFLVQLKHNRCILPEYSRYNNRKTEIQVRTILQHAWAEIEHDIQYKSEETIPTQIKRRFIALAGLIEIADREFQAIQNEDYEIRLEARQSVSEGKLAQVEITGDALKTYLDQKLGSDGRMTDSSYEWEAKKLIRYGFKNFQELDECLSPYDDDEISRKVSGGRQGQLTRFEYMLLAALGEKFITNHQWNSAEWWSKWKYELLGKIKSAGITTGTYTIAPAQ